METKKLFINNKWVDSNSGDYLEVENPMTQEVIAQIPKCDDTDVDKAVKAANDAFEKWQYTSIDERVKLMKKVVDLMEQKKDEISKIITEELGTPDATVTEIHIDSPIETSRYYIDLVKKFDFEEKRENALVRKEAVGVVGCITPWNYPLEQITKKVIPAILAGNTVVVKPSQKTPLAGYWLTEIFEEAGFPAGVYNMLTGKGSEIGNVLAEHPDIQMLSYTGSTKIGKKVGEKALTNIKKIALELGGKSPAIFLKDGDWETGVHTVLSDITSNVGQTCSAFSRMIVPKDGLDEVKELLKNAIGKYKPGDLDDPEVNMGPLSSEKQFERVKKYIEKGIDEGAELFLGDVPEFKGDYKVNPAVFTNVTNDMTIAREEIFGPVLCVITYEDVDEAIDIANDTMYGLSGLVVGPEDEAYDVATKIKTGEIYINDAASTSLAPFGGYKQSGLGRENAIEGFLIFLETKSVLMP